MDSELPEEVKRLAESLNAKFITTTGSYVRTVSADGNQVATASGGRSIWIDARPESVTRHVDSSVTVWRITSGELQKRFELDRAGYVHVMAFSPDGSTLAIGGHDKKTRLFDIRSDLPQASHVLAHSAPVKGLCFDSKGETLAVAAGTVQLWDMTCAPPTAGRESPLAEANLDGTEMAFSRDGSTLFYVDGVVVRRWEVARPFREQGGQPSVSSGGVQSLSVIPNTRQLLTAVERDGGSEILTRDFGSLASAPESLVTLTDCRIGDPVVSPDGRRFVFSAYRHPRYALEFWEQSQDGPKQLDVANLETGHPGSFWCTAFSPDGKTLASGHRDGAIRLWDVSGGRLVLRDTVSDVHWGGVGGLDYSPDGEILASVDWGGGVNLWDASGERMHRLDYLGRHDARAYDVRFSPDGGILATGDNNGAIKLWPVGKKPPKATNLTSHTASISSLVFSPDGTKLLSSGSDGRVIVWGVQDACPLREWRFPGPVRDAEFDPTGRQVVTANGNGSIYVWQY